MYLSQHSSESIPYVTAKHSKHDSFWLLPGVSSSFFCFGCAIENVENPKVLNYQKKHILTDLLEILLHNKTIWQLFATKTEIHLHVVTLLLTILIENDDSDLCELCSELCLLITKKTSPERTATVVVDRFMLKLKSFANASFLCFLKELINVVPVIAVNVCDNKAMFVVELLNFISTCKTEFQLAAWSLLSACLKAVVTEEITLSQNLLKHMLKTFTETNVSILAVDIEILRCLQSFIHIEKALGILLQHECSHLTVQTNSVLEHIKKMLLCSSEDGKKVAITCLTDITKKDVEDLSTGQETEFSSLLNLILQRGMTEYLLELLSSTNSTVIYELFQCLETLSNSKRFHSLGHMVYGFSSVIKAVHNTENTACCIKGLQLIDIILKGRLVSSSGEKTNITTAQINELMNLIKQCLDCPDEKVKAISTHCLVSFLRSSKSISTDVYMKLTTLLEVIFVFIERDVTSSLNSQMKPCQAELVANAYELILLFANHITSTNVDDTRTKTQQSFNTDPTNDNNQQEELSLKAIEQLFFLCDRYFIAQASLKFLPRRDVKFQSVFYRMVLSVIELDIAKGQMMAKKMSESTFIAKIYEFKIVVARISVKEPELSKVLGKLLLYLCMAIDESNEHNQFDENVLDSIVQFNIPLQEWRLCFGADDQMSSEYVTTQWTVMLILLGCTHIGGHILIPLPTLQPFVEQLASDPTSLLSLNILGKRFYVYLCCQLDISRQQGTAMPGSVYRKLCTQIMASNLDCLPLLFYGSSNFLAWTLHLNIPNSVFQSFLELYFNRMIDTDGLSNAFQRNNCLFMFVERAIKIFSSLTNEETQFNLSSFLETVLNGIPTERHGYLKHLIHKSLMFTEEFNHGVITVYARLLNTLCFRSSLCADSCCSVSVSEDDLKLFCRVLTYIRCDTVPTLLIETLKFCYLILANSIRAQDVKPITIAMKDDSLLATLSTLFFNNEEKARQSVSGKTTMMAERLYAAIVLMATQLIHCCQMFAVESPALSLSLLKESVAMDLFACNHLPILQLALISFWSCLLQVPYSKIVTFTHQQQQQQQKDDDGNSLSTNDYDLLIIILQNLSVHQEAILRQHAASCCRILVKESLTSARQFFASPWTRVMFSNTKALIASSKLKPSAVKMLQIFLSDRDNQVIQSTEEMVALSLDVLQCTTKVLEKQQNNGASNVMGDDGGEKLCFELVPCVTRFFEEFVDVFCGSLEYEKLKRIKADLKTMDRLWKTKNLVSSSTTVSGISAGKSTCSNPKFPAYVEIFELFFSTRLSAIVDGISGDVVGVVDVSLAVTRMRKQIEKRITEIDDDETESDDDE